MEKLETDQTKDRITDMLREEIFSGRIADGEELTQKQLAEILGVSRMPIREAMQILELEGFLVRLPNRHMQIVGISAQVAHESLRLVSAVEAEIAQILVEQGTPLPEEIDLKNNRRFHRFISEQIGNLYLQQTHRRLLNGYPEYIWRHCTIGVLEDHNARIWSAIKAKDNEGIQQYIRDYYCNLEKILLAHMKENGDEQPTTN